MELAKKKDVEYIIIRWSRLVLSLSKQGGGFRPVFARLLNHRRIETTRFIQISLATGGLDTPLDKYPGLLDHRDKGNYDLPPLPSLPR